LGNGKNSRDILEEDYKFDEKKHIPYWEEMILIWSSGWASFGMEYPHKNEDSIQPITMTYSPDNTENDQKTFNAF
jgi:hypothetical protein